MGFSAVQKYVCALRVFPHHQVYRVGVNQESKPEESGAGIGGIDCVPASKQPKSNVHQHIQPTCLETIPS